ncbi:MAG TPA: hypothetical protein VKZ81_28615 [Pseudonocardia sp.]|jgi:hypothetical protein|uniref:hypothetical protein n=1 Tax=Pseudonocardia sp. TaxID=60912 RepID=UPI002B4B8971|nr:hypothetical protein [Pseudonocardia sp.]HLU59443.1 hypothetical protein [Pseudonocardia sp.]
MTEPEKDPTERDPGESARPSIGRRDQPDAVHPDAPDRRHRAPDEDSPDAPRPEPSPGGRD